MMERQIGDYDDDHNSGSSKIEKQKKDWIYVCMG